MSKAPFFSVIIPTYNRAKSIGEAVTSVLNQTFRDFELLVIDDGSKDNTREVLEPLCDSDQRLRYVFQENAERSAARNHGIRLSKGQYICFLDSDDIYLPEHLEKLYAAILDSNMDEAMFVCNALTEHNGKRNLIAHYTTTTDDPMELVMKVAIASQQVAIHRSILRVYQYDIGIRVGEDQELWSRIVQKYPLRRTEAATVVIRDLGDRTIDVLDTSTYWSNIEVQKKIVANDKEGRIRTEWRRFAISGAYYKLALSYLSNRSYLNFYRYMLVSISKDPNHFLVDKLVSMLAVIPVFRPLLESKIPQIVKNIL
ncbi:MAG: glycosyltransferase family 2 protein [Flavobacteriales bacterium]|nr:glycosyltransferase family 2 protein [Flavobacteriales bacterium]